MLFYPRCSIFLIAIPLLLLRRVPLAIGEEKPAADTSSGPERERETPKAKAEAAAAEAAIRASGGAGHPGAVVRYHHRFH